MTTTTYTSFGDCFRAHRIKLGLTLRGFARKHGIDAGNLSRIERGLLQPASRELLERYANALELVPDSDEWITFFDLASVHAVQASVGIDEKVLAERLPIFFRTLRGQRVPPERLEELVALIRKQYS